jgi:glycosyltransferase involved in cell wall biosynthesis
VGSQTYFPTEIIVVDDGSTDRSVEIASRFAPHVQVITQANAGAAAARNRGIQAAKGDWIAFLDSDDQWHPEKLQLQLECANRFPSAKLVFCDTQTLQGEKVLMDSRISKGGVRGCEDQKDGMFSFFERLFPNMLQQSRVITSAVLVQRELPELSFPEHIWGSEDWALWLKLASRYAFAMVDQILVTMHQQGDNISSKKGKLYRNDLKVLYDLLSDPAVRDKEREEISVQLQDKTLGAFYFSLLDGEGPQARNLLKKVRPHQISRFKTMMYWMASFLPRKILRRARPTLD